MTQTPLIPWQISILRLASLNLTTFHKIPLLILLRKLLFQKSH